MCIYAHFVQILVEDAPSDTAVEKQAAEQPKEVPVTQETAH